MTIIQLLMQIDRKERTYSSVLYDWSYATCDRYGWKNWNNIYSYLFNRAYEEKTQ